jgi:hypothetical protein
VTGPRCFPPPWSAEETDACFIVRDANRQALAYVYCEEEPGPLPYALSSIAIIVQRQAASVYLKHSPPFVSMMITVVLGSASLGSRASRPFAYDIACLQSANAGSGPNPSASMRTFDQRSPGSTLCDLAAITSRCRNVDGSSAYRLAAFGLRHRLDCPRLSSASV